MRLPPCLRFCRPTPGGKPISADRTKINLNVDAAGVTGEVARAPVLIRLHSGNFNFKDVKPDGSDLRFVAGDDRTPLKFHIEKWSPQEEQALIWVDVQGLQPGQAAAVYAYYGNDTATAKQDVAGTFGPDYRLVYHFNDKGSPRDATANGADASGGEESQCRWADRIEPHVSPGPAPSCCPHPPSPPGRSASSWIKPNGDGTIFALPGAMSLVNEGGRLFIDQGGNRSAGGALAANAWANVAVVNDGSKSILYINGQPAGEVTGALAPRPARPSSASASPAKSTNSALLALRCRRRPSSLPPEPRVRAPSS